MAFINTGVGQLEEHDPEHNTFHVIWIHSAGQDPGLLNMRFHATLFGTQDLFSLNKDNLITCYYFTESSFFTHRNSLDGAILTYNDKAQLCVNTLSPNIENFRNSDLYISLRNGLCDPDKYHDSEDVMIADCDIDRKKSDEVIKYLCKKYGVEHLQTIDMKKYSGKILCPSNKR